LAKETAVTVAKNPEENIEIILGNTLEHILTHQQQTSLRAIVRNGLTTENFFTSLPRKQQRKLQFVDSDLLSQFTDSQRLDILRYYRKKFWDKSNRP